MALVAFSFSFSIYYRPSLKPTVPIAFKLKSAEVPDFIIVSVCSVNLKQQKVITKKEDFLFQIN